MKRHLLRSQLKTAWEFAIRQRYDHQLINSERGLQLYFCEALLNQFKESRVNRRLFVEPHLATIDGSRGRYPDIVICNTRRIIGIVEIKYAPRVGLTHREGKVEKDLETLSYAVARADTLTLSNDRYQGPDYGKKSYSLANDAVLCWAGVYKGPVMKLGECIGAEVSPHFLQLNALTRKSEVPEIVFS